MASIFISYSHQNRRFARKLAAGLHSYGNDIWIDEGAMRLGDSLLARIGDALHTVDYVVAILSRASVASHWVERELEIAMTREIAGKRVVVLPVVLDRVELPPFLAGKLYLRFSDARHFHRDLARLQRSIRPELYRNFPAAGEISAPMKRARLDAPGKAVLVREIAAYFTEPGTSALIDWEAFEEEERQSWNRDVYEGVAAAARCFVAVIQWHGLTSDDRKDVWFITVLMLIHARDVEKTCIGERDVALEAIELQRLLDENVDQCELGPVGNLQQELARWCPFREPEGYYIGWKVFCTWMNLSAEGHSESGIRKELPEYLAMTHSVLFHLLRWYEERFDPAQHFFWTFAERLVGYAAGDATAMSILHKLSRRDVDLASRLARDLGIDKNESAIRAFVERFTNRATGIRMYVLLLRLDYEFVGYTNDAGEVVMPMVKRASA